MKRILLPLICLLVLGGCKKDNINNVLIPPKKYPKRYPKEYLPTYPGSYWVYDNGDTNRTGVSYVVAEIFSANRNFGTGEVSCHSIETAMYTTYLGKYVKDYTVYGQDSKGVCTNETLLSEELGKIITLYSSKIYSTVLIVKSKDVQIELPNGKVYDNVIVMNKVNYGGPGPELDVEIYYAKGVGLIGQKTIENYFTQDTIPVWDKYLVDYHINY